MHNEEAKARRLEPAIEAARERLNQLKAELGCDPMRAKVKAMLKGAS